MKNQIEIIRPPQLKLMFTVLPFSKSDEAFFHFSLFLFLARLPTKNDILGKYVFFNISYIEANSTYIYIISVLLSGTNF